MHQGSIDSSKEISSAKNYKLFFDQREEIKKQTYEKVIWFGWIVLVTGFFFGSVPLILLTIAVPLSAGFSILIRITLLLAAVILDCGLLIVSTVPTDELNIDMIANRLKHYRLIHLILGLFLAVLDNDSFANGIPIESIRIDYTSGYICDASYYGIAEISKSIFFIILGIICTIYIYKMSHGEKKRGWGTAALYTIGYITIFAFGLTAITDNIGVLSYNNFDIYGLLLGIILMVPVIVVLIIGSKRVFTFMAARFEYDIDRLQRDGAFMAELVATTGVINEGDIRFVKRISKDGDERYKSNDKDNDVNKSWIYGGYRPAFLVSFV
eukprot:gene11796-24717_t